MQCCGRTAGGLNFSGWGIYMHMDRWRRGKSTYARNLAGREESEDMGWNRGQWIVFDSVDVKSG